MDVLIHLSCAEAVHIAVPLGRALNDQGVSWGCFLTNDGVAALADERLIKVLGGAGRVAACEHSWDLHMGGQDCPVERSSQTLNSALMAGAAKVVSL